MSHRRWIAATMAAGLVIAASCQRRSEPTSSASTTPTTPTRPPASSIVPVAPVPSAPGPVSQVPVAPALPAHASATAAAPDKLAPISEKQKIERMLVLLLESDAVFIRNGVDYDAKAAAAHLRTKWTSAGSRVKTANDFIDALASTSSTTGKPYQIRKKDGSIVASGEWFKELLATIEAGK